MKLSQIQNSLESLSGLGPAKAKLFSRLNIFTVADLLSAYPKKYEDRSKKIPLCQFQLYPKVYTICKVLSHEWFGYGKMKTLKIFISDGSAKACLCLPSFKCAENLKSATARFSPHLLKQKSFPMMEILKKSKKTFTFLQA